MKQTDKDGHFDYSKIVKVTTACELTNTVLTVFPGIISQNGILTIKLTNVTIKGGYYVSCTDISGRQVFRKKIEVNMPESNHQVTISNLANGTYFLNVSNAVSGQSGNVARFQVQ